MQVLYLGRSPRTNETLPDFLKWCRVTRHPLAFLELTGSQRTPGFGASHISLSKGKNISKGIQEMPILQTDKSLKNNSLEKDKHLSSGDKSPSKDKLFSK